MPALASAARDHADGYVRFRALVLLTGFNDPAHRRSWTTLTADRTIASGGRVSRYFEHNPDPVALPAAGRGLRRGEVASSCGPR